MVDTSLENAVEESVWKSWKVILAAFIFKFFQVHQWNLQKKYIRLSIFAKVTSPWKIE